MRFVRTVVDMLTDVLAVWRYFRAMRRTTPWSGYRWTIHQAQEHFRERSSRIELNFQYGRPTTWTREDQQAMLVFCAYADQCRIEGYKPPWWPRKLSIFSDGSNRDLTPDGLHYIWEQEEMPTRGK